MDKRVVSVGNSVAVIIERPLCRMLDIRRGSRVRVSTDGARILIEPVREPRKTTSFDVVGIAEIATTLACWGIPDDAVTQLHPGLVGPRAFLHVMAWAEVLKSDGPEIDRIYARRFRVCLETRRDGGTWETAVAAALAAAPDLPAAG